MIDHLTLSVRDLARSKAFFVRVLAPLGYSLRMTFEGYCGFGDAAKPYFWIKQGKRPSEPMHLAFQAKNHAAVDAFHRAALAAGAADDGKPGPRPDYHANYYGAFVIDLDGHHLEAVCHAPAAKKATRSAKKAPVSRTKAKPATRRSRS